MYVYAYNGTWHVYDDLAPWWYYMMIDFTYEYVLVYIVKEWWYVIVMIFYENLDVGYDSCCVTWLSKVMGLCLVIALVDSIGVHG